MKMLGYDDQLTVVTLPFLIFNYAANWWADFTMWQELKYQFNL